MFKCFTKRFGCFSAGRFVVRFIAGSKPLQAFVREATDEFEVADSDIYMIEYELFDSTEER